MRGFLADYSVDLEVYDYWLWRYYPEWIEWYRNQQSQAGQDSTAETAADEQSTAGNATAAESNAADTQERAAGTTLGCISAIQGCIGSLTLIRCIRCGASGVVSPMSLCRHALFLAS